MLKDKIIVVSGGNGFLAKKFIPYLLDINAKVIALDLCFDIDFFDELKTKYNDKILTIVSSITSKQSLEKSIEIIELNFGEIDVLINTAHPKNENYLLDINSTDYDKLCENLNNHLGGYFLIMQTFTKSFLKNGKGSIINFSSIYGNVLPRFEIYEDVEFTSPIDYSLIKPGVKMMTKYFAKFYKGKNLRFNTISPGGIYNNHSEKFTKKYNKFSVNKGMLDPEDLFGTLYFLCSDLSNFVNGQDIVVDDGWSL